MKKSRIWFILICTGMMSIGVHAMEEETWLYSKPIMMEKTKGYKEFYVDEELYKYSNDDLSDIRIINDKDEKVPYYIVEEEMVYNNVRFEYNLELLNAFRKGNDRYFDYRVENKESNKDVIGNELVIELDISDYMKNVTIYGSYDNLTWEYIKSDLIFEVPNQVKDFIYLEDGLKYNYYRIVFINDVEKDVIESAKLVYNKDYAMDEKYSLSKSVSFDLNTKDQKTTVRIDNKDRLKIKGMSIIASDLYNRRFVLSVKNKEEQYMQIEEGGIYQIQLENFEAMNNTINISNTTKSEELMLVIDNKDDKVIDIKEIQIDYYVDKIVFEGSETGKSYYVLFGNKLAKKPSYDIKSYSAYIEQSEKKEEVTLGQLVAINEKGSVKSEVINTKLVFNILIVVISLGLVAIIIRKLKSEGE